MDVMITNWYHVEVTQSVRCYECVRKMAAKLPPPPASLFEVKKHERMLIEVVSDCGCGCECLWLCFLTSNRGCECLWLWL